MSFNEILEGTNLTTEIRYSKDGKIDERGIKVAEFCEDHGFIILNGRTLGDEEGELSFIFARGSSTIDLGMVSISYVKNIRHFEIIPETFSDHLPIKLILAGLNVDNNNRLIPLLPKLLWNKEQEINFIHNLKTCIKWDEFKVNDVDLLLERFIGLIKQAAGKNNFFHKPKTGEKWFDNECYRSRKTSFKFLNLFRKTNSVLMKNWYLLENKNYKTLCKRKKISFYESLVAKIEGAKDNKDFWESINALRKKTYICNPHIPIDRWVYHFRQLLNPPLLSGPIHYAEPYIYEESLDSRIINSRGNN